MANLDTLSIQLYSFRFLPSLDVGLDAVAAAGIRQVEAVGSHLDNAAETQAKLAARGLKATTSHVGMVALRDKLPAVVDACKTLGISQLFMPSVPPDQRKMEAAGWTAIGHELGELSHKLKESGIALGYHNHNWELDKKTADKNALELLLEAASGSPLNWQADVAWLARGGADPKVWLERFRALVVSVHVKDIAPQGENLDQDGWADVGAGTLDWPELWRVCVAAGAKTMVLEHDKPADGAAFVRNSAKYLQGMKA